MKHSPLSLVFNFVRDIFLSDQRRIVPILTTTTATTLYSVILNFFPIFFVFGRRLFLIQERLNYSTLVYSIESITI